MSFFFFRFLKVENLIIVVRNKKISGDSFEKKLNFFC